MSHKIDSSQVGAAGAAAPIRAVDRNRDKAPSAAKSSDAGDRIELTGEAQILSALEGRVRAGTGVDAGKVAEVRRMLAEGRYSANAAAIAARVVTSEIELK